MPLVRRTAKQFYQTVVATAAAHVILRAQALRRNLKRSEHVVVDGPRTSRQLLAVNRSAHFRWCFTAA